MKKLIVTGLLTFVGILILQAVISAEENFKIFISDKPPEEILRIDKNTKVAPIAKSVLPDPIQENGVISYKGVIAYVVSQEHYAARIIDAYDLVAIFVKTDENGNTVPEKVKRTGIVWVKEKLAWFKSQKDKEVFETIAGKLNEKNSSPHEEEHT